MTHPGEDWQERERHRREVAAQARALPREPAGWLPRAALGVAVAAWLGMLAWSAATLPDVVPLHWGGSGDRHDRWGSRTESLVTTVLVGLVVLPMPLLSRLAVVWPDGINHPSKDWWLARPRRVVRFERLLREDLMVLTALTVALVCGLEVLGGRAAHQGGSVPEAWFWGATGGYLALAGVVTVRMVTGPRYDPDQSDPALA